MVKIENFNTGPKANPDVANINLDPSENIKNKKKIKQLLKNIVESDSKNLEKNINNAYHPNAELKCFHPVNNISGIDEIYHKLWLPIKNSFTDLERRDCLVLGGSFQDKVFVSTISLLTGTYKNSWLGIPTNNKTIHLRMCEAHEIKDGKIIHSHILLDVIDFIRQAGFWPINKSNGAEGLWTNSIAGDGAIFENIDKQLSLSSLEQALTMQRSLNIKPESDPNADHAYVKEKLIHHPQKEFWHKKMMWYGPSGIGTARGLEGFVDHHQLPFRMTFRERDYWKIGHYVELGDGNYSMTGGWHSIDAIHGEKDWLGYEATGKSVTMRVMDFYHHHEGLIRENWVPIDIVHILKQLDIDVFELIKEQQ